MSKMNVDPQNQSLFFTLPLEIRRQIEKEYLCEYMRGILASPEQDGQYFSLTKGNMLYGLILVEEHLRITPCQLSPLTTSCKRMYLEMRRGDHSWPSEDGRLSVGNSLMVMRAGRGQGIDCIRVALEGEVPWRNIQTLRFINEREYPGDTDWTRVLGWLIKYSSTLSQLEFEWSPKMSIIHNDERTNEYISTTLESIRAHPTLQTVYVRGNVPKALVEANVSDAKPPKRIVSEQLILWDDEVNAKENEQAEREKSARRAEQDNDRIYREAHIRMRLEWEASRPKTYWQRFVHWWYRDQFWLPQNWYGPEGPPID